MNLVESRSFRKKFFNNPFFTPFRFIFGKIVCFFDSSTPAANQFTARTGSSVYPLAFFLRRSSLLKLVSLTDLFGSDYPTRVKRFRVTYRFRRLLYAKMWLGKKIFRWEKISTVFTNALVKDRSVVATITSLYKSRLWFERECWDLYGVYFSNNPDLRRILTDYGFTGFPFRKDFPLSGYVQSRYDFSVKKVNYEAVDFRFGQSYRYFDFKSPWEKKNKRLFLKAKVTHGEPKRQHQRRLL